MYDINKVRADFPILSRTVYDRPLVYLDNGATTQKPLCVLDAMREEYLNANANVHRGVHYLSQRATDLHEAARETVRQFINAPKTEEIIFTRGTTESINLVAASFCEAFMAEGDEVIVSVMEHHSNIVPWQLQAAKRGIALKVIPMDDSGKLDMKAYEQLFSERTKIVSVAHVSNTLGTVNPVKEIVRIAHEHGVPVLVDGAQSTPHFAVDVQSIDCDFFAFSGHKIYGPTGIGVLYGKEEWLDRMPPYQGGGEMIESVSFEKTTFEKLPFKFEAGTPDYVATHGLATALNYVSALGMDNIAAHERELTDYCMTRLVEIDGMRLFGTTEGKDAVVSFLVGDIHHFNGVASVNDPLWTTNYEQIYSHPELMLNWFPVLGNHEYRGNTQAVLDYGTVSRRWVMPSRYYTKVITSKGTSVRVVFIDTTPLIDRYRADSITYPDAHKQDMQAQLNWLDNTLKTAREDWVIVVGHHPIYAHTPKDESERTDMQKRVLPILKRYHNVAIYACGHIHNFQHIKMPADDIDYVVNSSSSLARPVQAVQGTVFCSPADGFSVISATKEQLNMYMIDKDGKAIHTISRHK